MLAYARLRPGPGFRAGRAAAYYAQRLVPWPLARRAVARGIAAVVRRRYPDAPFSDALAPAVAASLNEKGYAVVPDLLSPEAIADLAAYLASQSVVLRDGREMALAAVPAGTSIADYPLRTVLAAPHVLRHANAPFLLTLARAFLGCTPTISTIGIRWSFPGRASAATQAFHRDPDDWRFFKAFVYLSDVDETCGPHLYVRGSHRDSGSLRARTFARDAVEQRYGSGAIVTITGAAGTSFVADTWGVHAGPVPSAKRRLMLEIGYSVLPVYALDYVPLRLSPRPAVDAYVNRLLIAP
jgi:hypothetical protein